MVASRTTTDFHKGYWLAYLPRYNEEHGVNNNDVRLVEKESFCQDSSDDCPHWNCFFAALQWSVSMMIDWLDYTGKLEKLQSIIFARGERLVNENRNQNSFSSFHNSPPMDSCISVSGCTNQCKAHFCWFTLSFQKYFCHNEDFTGWLSSEL